MSEFKIRFELAIIIQILWFLVSLKLSDQSMASLDTGITLNIDNFLFDWFDWNSFLCRSDFDEFSGRSWIEHHIRSSPRRIFFWKIWKIRANRTPKITLWIASNESVHDRFGLCRARTKWRVIHKYAYNHEEVIWASNFEVIRGHELTLHHHCGSFLQAFSPFSLVPAQRNSKLFFFW